METPEATPPESKPEATPKPKKAGFNLKPWQWAVASVGAVVLVGGGALAVMMVTGHSPIKDLKQGNLPSKNAAGQTVTYDKQASVQLTSGKCEGVGSVPITAPMPIAQIGSIQPYGLMVGGHVTPVDHQYYIGLDGRALRDTYDVVAPADGWLVAIQHRGDKYNTPAHTVDVPSSDEYRLVFSHTCSFLTYVDLVTSLSDQVKAAMPGYDPRTGNGFKPFKVTKGEIIGHIGGQTLDFAVWDLSQTPLPFIARNAYDNAESWKVFTAPTTKYLDPAIKDAVVAKYIRTADPVDGLVCYDQDGKLVGTWFAAGTNGYLGATAQGPNPGYWRGHLSFAPNYIDPSAWMVSIGNYPGVIPGASTDPNAKNANAQQFGIKGNGPDPTTITPSSGMVKYELVQQELTTPDGQRWMGDFAHGVKAENAPTVRGTLLVQMTGKRELKVEVFPDKLAAEVSGFDSGAKTYNRGEDATTPASNTAH